MRILFKLYQRMMIQNPFASSRLQKQPYNYESNLLCNIRLIEALSIIERSCDICDKCHFQKKNHYCIEPQCNKKELICPQCNVSGIGDTHYMHDHTYILPLLSKDISNNFFKLKRKVTSYHQEILEEIVKMEEYLSELRKIQAIARKKLEELQIQQKDTKIKDYIPKMQDFIKSTNKNHRMSSILERVVFKSAEQCIQRQQQIKAQIINHLNNLKWPKDPQKVLKQKFTKVSYEDEKKEIFISSKKILELNEIDSSFRSFQQFYTNNLQSHQIQIKIQPDYTSKPKYYESFIHHFRNCKHLSIQNASINQLRTPLSFRRLKSLQFSFNTDLQFQNSKIDNVSPQLSSLTFRKCRQQDIKILKNIASVCDNLKRIHLEFANKIDLFHYKDLIEFLQQVNKPKLVQFILKIRTENEVKRLYGYLSKFYKQFCNESNCNLSESILRVLQINPFLTKVIVQGVKPLNMSIVLSKLKRLTYLMDYKIYYQNIDLMTQVDDKQAKQLQDICYKRKRIFYALAKASKQKRYPRTVINRIVQQMLI